MAADRQSIRALLADLDPAVVRNLLSRLEEDYLQQFTREEVNRHVRKLLTLAPDNPAALILRQRPDRLVECTVVAFDHPFEFSLITGILAGTGFGIQSSDVFTLRPPAARKPFRRRELGIIPPRNPLSDAAIVDVFAGQLLGPLKDFDAWAAAFEPAMKEVIALLEGEEEQLPEKAKRLVNERVTQWLTARRAADPRSAELPRMLQLTQVDIEQRDDCTRLRLKAQDAPAFLYALSTALSLHGLSIQKTRIRTVDGRAEDAIDFVDSHGKPLTDQQRLERVKLSVLLTQQFAYFLDRSPDPFTALGRFEKLAETAIQLPQRGEWIRLLSDPRAMADLARVLGASDYLWEDFIRLHAESLLPIFRHHARNVSLCAPSYTLPRRLAGCLFSPPACGARLAPHAGGLNGAPPFAPAPTFDQLQDRLNEFKDHELFLIDLDHILSGDDPDASFRILSERLVLLAENLVAAAVKLVYEELVARYGQPVDESGRPIPYAVFGLGKLGGVALGYASDIELLFLYGGSAGDSAPGRTQGEVNAPIAASEFFHLLVQQTALFIHAKREGIFHIDLRLRPHGDGGPLACSVNQFSEYYGQGGQAHAFERLALVRLRWIAGDPALGFQIEQLRDRLLYDGPPPDLDALWEIWEKMHAQKLKGCQLNSKYSPGALADLEGAVQLLQVIHAKTAPQLRTPRLLEAVEALRRAGVLSPAEYETVSAAYHFFRRLINAQRMLRGSAQDLLLPPANSDDLLHLARRMHYPADPQASTPPPDPAAQLLSDFHRHTVAVQAFIHRRFGRACPGASPATLPNDT